MKRLASSPKARRPRTTVQSGSPVPRFRPTLSFTGKQATPFKAAKIGQKVSALVHGTVTNVGLDTYEPGRPLRATVEINQMKVNR